MDDNTTPKRRLLVQNISESEYHHLRITPTVWDYRPKWYLPLRRHGVAYKQWITGVESVCTVQSSVLDGGWRLTVLNHFPLYQPAPPRPPMVWLTRDICRLVAKPPKPRSIPARCIHPCILHSSLNIWALFLNNWLWSRNFRHIEGEF